MFNTAEATRSPRHEAETLYARMIRADDAYLWLQDALIAANSSESGHVMYSSTGHQDHYQQE